MKMNRQRAIKAFQDYTSHYDVNDEKVKLKIDHTYRVSSLCQQIAVQSGFDKDETELAWLTGLLHDADKIDILKVNIIVPLEEIYNVTTYELKHCQVTQEVMQAFYEEHAVLRSLKKTPVDNVVGHISLVYELVYPISCKLVSEQGYLDQLMNFQSELPQTNTQFAKIREKMAAYIKQKEISMIL